MFAEQLAEAGCAPAGRRAGGRPPAQLDKPAERSVAQQRRDTLQSLMTHGEEWIDRQGEMLRDAAVADRPSTGTGALVASMQGHTQKLMLVDDETVQKEIFISRLSQAIVDQAVWEFNDLSTRVAALEGLDELADHDLFRPQQIAKIVVRSFIDSDFGPDAWSGVESVVKAELSALTTEGYHEANRFLIEKGVLPDVNLRTLIRRSVDRAPVVASRQMPLEDFNNTSGGASTGSGGTQFAPTTYGGPGGGQGGHGGGQGSQGGYGGGQGGYGGQGGNQGGYAGGQGGGGQGGYGGGQGGGQGGYGGGQGSGGQGGYGGGQGGGGQGGYGGGQGAGGYGGGGPGGGGQGGYGPGHAGGNGGGAGGATGYAGGNGQGGQGGGNGGGGVSAADRPARAAAAWPTSCATRRCIRWATAAVRAVPRVAAVALPARPTSASASPATSRRPTAAAARSCRRSRCRSTPR